MLILKIIFVAYVIPLLASYFGVRYLHKHGEIEANITGMIMAIVPLANIVMMFFVSLACFFLVADKLVNMSDEMDSKEKNQKIASSFFRVDKED